ncbi:helix-turn-helix domain-containing protein [Streptomyces erythrochromogenes]|uniref:helix-turn-helix domain-containing protein n=1 Tax=Streptomyces erythrochromogenes TaxID=285574 RepID=UPI00224ED67D|nr:helix-turn-helix domain-containing protein [Streptomyces erythrochromogenes]MCX5587557.1 helix-turn-helix domain-containing protein [Streptomyces erythrochromogenes]
MNNRDNPVTDAEREQIRRLHAEGHGRNEIARRTGRGTRTISVQCAAMNLVFDNTATEAATAARNAQLAEKRSILADALVDDALRLTEQMWQPAKVYNIGGKDNTYTEQLVPEPPAADKRALMTAATAAAAQSLRLVPPETETEGMAAVDQWLRGMMGGTPAPE